MAYGSTTHRIAHTFEVEIQRDEETEREDRRYRACCPRLAGCTVYAKSEAEALLKVEWAIDAWLDVADRLIGDDPTGIMDMIHMRI